MKKMQISGILLILCLMVLSPMKADAQILRAEELEKYSVSKYGDNWIDAATSLATTIELDKNNAMTFVKVIDAPGKSKEELYTLLNYWYTTSFNDADAVINLNDKDLGCIIAQGFVKNIAFHTGGMNHYEVSIRPTIKSDIKDDKVRVTYSVPFYSVKRVSGGGLLGSSKTAETSYENWVLDKCKPFAEKDSHKKTSCKAFVMSYAYSNVILDKIEECITNGLVGNETDEW